MKTRYQFFAVIISFTLVTGTVSCKKEKQKEPVSCFSPSKQLIDFEGIVNFQNCSSDYERVEWNFGDGGSSTLVEPSHKFEKVGVFDVALTVFNGDKSNKTVKPVVCGLKARVDFGIEFSDWHVPQNYNEVRYLCVLFEDGIGIASLGWAQTFQSPDPNKQPVKHVALGILPNEDKKYFIRIYAQGHFSGSNPDLMDLIEIANTKEFQVFSGPDKNIIETIKFGTATAKYSLGIVFF